MKKGTKENGVAENVNSRLILGKVGLDAHDMGPRILARGLRDEGVEVIYLGLRCTPEEIIQAAIQEDAQVIGISSYCGGHIPYAKTIMTMLKRSGLDKDKAVIFGGVIPRQDIATLKDIGVDRVFMPEDSIVDVANYVKAYAGDSKSGLVGS
ncbi:MAG: cobalamin B12-binding domain-containing protein [Chloroflexi bacterium]|nr:cobalamin B12-binding domain-containing protein [Chloroflexota bacterium]